MYDFLNVSCTALFQVLKNHPLVVWHHCGPGSVNETPHNMQWIIAFDLPTATITHQTMTQMCLHKCSYWLNLQQLEILESKSIQCWQFSERSLLIIMCPLYFLHGSCIRLYDTNNIPVLLYMDIYGIVFGCFFGYCGVWWAPWFGWFRAIQMITQRHEGKFWIHVVLKYDVLATFSASTYPVSTSWDIPFKEASQRILTPSHEAADLPIAPPNRSDTACHNIKLMRKQGHVEENIRKQGRIMSENLESQQVASWWLQGFPDNYLKEGRRHFAEKPSITHLIAGKPAQVKGLSADSDVNHTGRARSL